MTLRLGNVTRPAGRKWTVEVAREKAERKETPKVARVETPAATQPGGAYELVDLSSAYNNSVASIFKRTYLSPRSPYCSLSIPKQGFGGWCTYSTTPEIDDAGIRAAGGKLDVKGVPFATAREGRNVAFVSMWENDPHEVSVPAGGKARAAVLLMAGSTTNMQSRMDNGEVVATYTDGSVARVGLRNPTNWWPIEQDFFVDDYAFRIDAPMPVRVDLKTGKVRVPRKGAGGMIPGGSATVVTMALDPEKQLRSVTVRALCNESVIGLMSLTLQRP
jgi:hypothetical protein